MNISYSFNVSVSLLLKVLAVWRNSIQNLFLVKKEMKTLIIVESIVNKLVVPELTNEHLVYQSKL
jgi:hypothetical protein